jgi:molybdate transport system ATP-binding protein
MVISIDIQRRVVSGSREFTLDVCIESKCRRIALFGPSGSGKTLTLQCLAGLLRQDMGRIEVDGEIYSDAQRNIWLSTQARRVAYLQQDYALFPHLSISQNITFGLNKSWLNPGQRFLPPPAQRWVQAFELESILHSYPGEISGGQKQRVALARALAAEPRLLLLDEPMAAVDAQLRRKMRAELAALQKQFAIPIILITHDPEDVVALSEQVYMIRDGRIIDVCTPSQLMLSQEHRS